MQAKVQVHALVSVFLNKTGTLWCKVVVKQWWFCVGFKQHSFALATARGHECSNDSAVEVAVSNQLRLWPRQGAQFSEEAMIHSGGWNTIHRVNNQFHLLQHGPHCRMPWCAAVGLEKCSCKTTLHT